MSEAAFRAIGDVAAELGVEAHVLRFWETKFPEVAPIKRAGGRRYYRPGDVALLRAVHSLLHKRRYTVRGVRQLIDARGAKALAAEFGGGDAGASADWRAELAAVRAELAAALAAYRGAG